MTTNTSMVQDVVKFVIELLEARLSTADHIVNISSRDPQCLCIARAVLDELTGLKEHVEAKLRERYGEAEAVVNNAPKTSAFEMPNHTVRVKYSPNVDADTLHLRFRETGVELVRCADEITNRTPRTALKLSGRLPKMTGDVRYKIMLCALRINHVAFTASRNNTYHMLQASLFSYRSLDHLLKSIAYAVVTYPDNLELQDQKHAD